MGWSWGKQETSKGGFRWIGLLPLIKVLLVVALVLGLAHRCTSWVTGGRDGVADISTITTLEKIIDVSELSTFTAVYNGIAEVHNEAEPVKIDYYVSYQARVNAGIDFEQVSITLDEEEKCIRVKLPPANIQDTNVDIASLDFIFNDPKANVSTVSQQAYRACMEDVREESAKRGEILELAQQNAQNVIRALTTPYLDSFYADYELVIE